VGCAIIVHPAAIFFDRTLFHIGLRNASVSRDLIVQKIHWDVFTSGCIYTGIVEFIRFYFKCILRICAAHWIFHIRRIYSNTQQNWQTLYIDAALYIQTSYFSLNRGNVASVVHVHPMVLHLSIYIRAKRNTKRDSLLSVYGDVFIPRCSNRK
jgi:hypothetical protein